MVLRNFYNSLSWTNKRRIDSLLVALNKLKTIVKKVKIPKIKRPSIERTKVTKKKVKEVEIEVKMFPDDHRYIGYRIEKHESGDRIFMIEKPPHPTTCVCDECMDSLDKYVTQMRKELEEDE